MQRTAETMINLSDLSPARLAALIDHSVLKPDATAADVPRACAEVRKHGIYAVCVAPVWVESAVRALGDTARVVAVIGFPHGNTLPEAKANEAWLALAAGASELDMVVQIGALKSGEPTVVSSDIEGVVDAARAHGALVKVILETALLTEEEKLLACRLAEDAGAHFVKTSTGFGPGGATAEDVALLRRAVGERLGVKAAGGIRTLDQALVLLRAGATRLGTSASVSILEALRRGDAG
jgi:deoxyribose-phosphate aldolase